MWQLIKEKLPVSISLGLWTFLISYLISMPLGIAKAVREGSRFDVADHARACWSATRSPASCSACFLIVLFAGGTFWECSRCAG